MLIELSGVPCQNRFNHQPVMNKIGNQISDNTPHDDARLSRIETLWSVVRRAHEADNDSAESAQRLLLERYGGAIQRYLLAAVRDQHVADELFQEFAVKLIKGDYKKANPEVGKFRSYVKTSLFRLVAGYHRKHSARKERNLENVPDADSRSDDFGSTEDKKFLQVWRDTILAKSWRGLESSEANGGPPYHTILRLRVQNPASSSAELAELISSAVGKQVTSGNARVQIHRAREKFAHALFETIADSLEKPTREAVEAELIEVGLIEYCRDALDGFQFV